MKYSDHTLFLPFLDLRVGKSFKKIVPEIFDVCIIINTAWEIGIDQYFWQQRANKPFVLYFMMISSSWFTKRNRFQDKYPTQTQEESPHYDHHNDIKIGHILSFCYVQVFPHLFDILYHWKLPPTLIVFIALKTFLLNSHLNPIID